MVRYIFFIVLTWFTTFAVRADGPPMDSTGKISCKFISVALDSSQTNHLRNHRWLTLNAEQKKLLHLLNLPKYIDVFDPFHADCTCGQIYAMWYVADSIGFCVSDSIRPVINEDDIETSVWYTLDANFVNRVDSNSVYIDVNGQIFYGEKTIAAKDIPKIIEQVRKDRGSNYILIFQPPAGNNPNSKAVLQTKEEIRKLLPEDFGIWWM